MIIGIDPGPRHSAYALIDSSGVVEEAGKVVNESLRSYLRRWLVNRDVEAVCIESIQSYGAPVGRETFETCYEIGRLLEICDNNFSVHQCPSFLYPRQEYANTICGVKANDAILRAALLTRFGGDKKGEPMHALKGSTDLRSAFAIAVYHTDKTRWEARRTE